MNGGKSALVNGAGDRGSSRLHSALQMKDEQLHTLQKQNRELLDEIDVVSEESDLLRKRVLDLETASLRVQDENLELQRKAKTAKEEGRLEAELILRQDVDASTNQLRVMSEQNTELLKLLEDEESRGKQREIEISSLNPGGMSVRENMNGARETLPLIFSS